MAEEFKKQFTCVGENNEKYVTLTVPIEKKLQELTVQGLWQSYDQILSVIVLK